MSTNFIRVLLWAFLWLLISNVSVITAQSAELAPATSGNLSKHQVDAVVQRFRGKPYKDFADFCLALYDETEGVLSGGQRAALGNFVVNEQLSGGQREVLFRVLGIYTQLKYGGEALQALGKLVKIPTVHDPKVAQPSNRNVIAAGKLIKKMAKRFGLKFRSIDNRVFEVRFPWQPTKGASVAVHAHVDVVPAPNDWRLSDGKKIDPFKLTRVGNRLYGRGTQDDKNGIVAALFAMRVIVEENIRLFNNVVLLIDTNEETTGDALDYYFKRNPTPEYNIALDGNYPVVIAEKGLGWVKARFPIQPEVKLNTDEAVFTRVAGGQAYNQIPGVSQAILKTNNALQVAQHIEQLGQQMVQELGGDFSIATMAGRDQVTIIVTGVSAHSSEPHNGVNPVPRMMQLIQRVTQSMPIRDNHITNAANYMIENWGLGYLGKNLGIDYRHPFMGPLTAAATKLSDDGQVFEIAVNLRIPSGQPLAQLENQINRKLIQWRSDTAAQVDFSISTNAPMYRNPDGLWVKALLAVASENLDLPEEFGSSAGGTSIHDLPNGVQFGLSIPSEKYTGHTTLEHKSLDQFLLDLHIVTEMMARIGQMQRLN